MLAACLQDAGIASVGTVRDSARTRLPCGVVLRRFDGQRADAALTAGIAATDAVPTPIPPDADGGPTCRRFADALAASRAGRIAYPSSTGGYGDLGGGRIDETAVADARHPAALTWFAVEVQWRALGERAGIPVAALRRPGLYGPAATRWCSRLAAARATSFAPAWRFRACTWRTWPRPCSRCRICRSRGLSLADDEAAPPQDVLAHAAAPAGLPLPPAQDWRGAIRRCRKACGALSGRPAHRRCGTGAAAKACARRGPPAKAVRRRSSAARFRSSGSAPGWPAARRAIAAVAGPCTGPASSA